MEVSVVVPAFNDEAVLVELVLQVSQVIEQNLNVDYEIVIVDDGSSDGTWSQLQSLKTKYAQLKAWRTLVNRGQHAAIRFGLSVASGDSIIVMDSDLQDRPTDIPILLTSLKESRVDAVFAASSDRGANGARSLSSRLFGSLFSKITGWGIEQGTGNFGAYSRRMVNYLNSLGGSELYLPYAVRASGLPYEVVKVNRDGRAIGSSSYSTLKRARLALKILVWNSNRLLGISLVFSLAVIVLLLGFGVYVLNGYFTGQTQVAGWTSQTFLILFTGSVILISNWVLGLYIGKILTSMTSGATKLSYFE